MKKLYIVALAVAALLGGACEKVIEFKGEIAAPRLTIAAQAVAGDPFPVYVASSVFFLDNNRAENAYTKNLDTLRGEVRCYVNGSKQSRKMVLHADAGHTSYCYLAEDYVPAPGDHIRVEAEFPGFDLAWAETDVPLLPKFEIVSTTWTLQPKSWEGEQDYYQVDMTLTVTDDASYDKYYCLQPIQGYYFVPGEMSFVEVVPFKSSDIIFQQLDVSAFQRFDFQTGEPLAVNYFTDSMIKGKSYTFKIQLVGVASPEDLNFFSVRLSTVNESLYWFDMSFSQQEYQFDLFSEGVTIYSNVHGGYGVLCAAAPAWADVEW
ncbi:MAG: DUF4249 family protein [Bacteroidales bacterium]|nr:DUF4249 family protein [Bacteroidales bacterium]